MPAAASRRIPLFWWVTSASVCFALFVVAVSLNATVYGMPVLVAFACALLVGAAPLAAALRPWVGTVVIAAGLGGTAMYADLADGLRAPWPITVTGMIALALVVGTACYRGGWRPAVIAWGVCLVVALIAVGGTVAAGRMTAGRLVADLVVAFAVPAVAFLIAFLLAGRNTARAELAREKALSADEQARRLVVEERARIARELHDVVAHGMSLIQVQASTARYRLPEIDETAADEFDSIAASARETMGEMRRLLGALRPDAGTVGVGAAPAELAPQQTVADLPRLVESARRAGAEIDAVLDPAAATAPPSVQVIAYRLVQEAVSNALRHAPGARIRLVVSVRRAPDAIELTVSNPPGGAPAPDAAGGGHGIIGMRERAAMLGGELSVGPADDGGWAVQAVLPLAPRGRAPWEGAG